MSTRVDLYGRPVNQYDVGDELVVNMTFRDPAGDEASLELCTVKCRSPAGAVATYEFPGTDPELEWLTFGSYKVTIPLTQSGTWYYRIAGQGIDGGNAAEEREVDVRQSYF